MQKGFTTPTPKHLLATLVGNESFATFGTLFTNVPHCYSLI